VILPVNVVFVVFVIVFIFIKVIVARLAL